MKKEEVKKKSEELATKIFEFIHSTNLSLEEKDEIFLEIAASFLTSAIHENTLTDSVIHIKDAGHEVTRMSIVGYSKYLLKELDGARILSDLTNKED